MLIIKDQAVADATAQIPLVDAHMRWLFNASKEVIGQELLGQILKEQNLDHLCENLPEDRLILSTYLTFRDYANLCSAIIVRDKSHGMREAIEIGRISAKPALERQGKSLNFAARQAIKLLPMPLQTRTVLESIQTDIRKIYQNSKFPVHLSIKSKGNKWVYINKACPLCAGKESNAPICKIWDGTIQESLFWLTGKEFEIHQTSCSAMGDAGCAWEVSKTPL